jgi:hypothetical protein
MTRSQRQLVQLYTAPSAALNREELEHAVDILFTDYDYRRREPDPHEDADAERYQRETHEPIYEGGEHDGTQ